MDTAGDLDEPGQTGHPHFGPSPCPVFSIQVEELMCSPIQPPPSAAEDNAFFHKDDLTLCSTEQGPFVFGH